MKFKTILVVAGAAAMGIVLAALPTRSATPQTATEKAIAKLQSRIDELEAKLQSRWQGPDVQTLELAGTENIERALAQQEDALQMEVPDDIQYIDIESPAEGGSWLGVETHEVTSENAKTLKLNAERGVVIGKVIPDSPAAKAGLKENDVVTEINGQQVEGTSQFRRLIREIPAGRTVQLGVWRDGRAQNISAALAKSEERHRAWSKTAPGVFAFHMPDMPEVRALPDMKWNGELLFGGRPRLGIDAEDLSGQLGAFFGAPDGEGVLVREVKSGSPAEKAGMKAGDVITLIDGERVHGVGELREKLASKRDDKPVKVAVLRNRSEMTLNVELPASAPKAKKLSMHKTNI